MARFRFPGLLALVAGVMLAALSPAAPVEVELVPQHRLTANAPEWRDLIERFGQQPDLVAEFQERRQFPFRKEPVILTGEVRLSRARGLSLHYVAPEQRTLIVDAQGVLIREPGRDNVPPDARMGSANAAMLHILRFDFAALESDFELYGRREGAAWALALVPRAEAVRKAIGNIHVHGEGGTVQGLDLRKSAKQHIAIRMFTVRSPVTFTAEELKAYFR